MAFILCLNLVSFNGKEIFEFFILFPGTFRFLSIQQIPTYSSLLCEGCGFKVMLHATVDLSNRCVCSLWFVFVNGSFQCPQLIKLGKKMSCTINLILCLWLWLTVGAGVCVCDLYLSLNVSCESDSNMMFPTHKVRTHTQSATST